MIISNEDTSINLGKINIICNIDQKNSYKVAQVLMKFLEKNSFNYTCQDISPKQSLTDLNFDKDATFVVTIGGDGTLLSSARFYSNFDVPVFGINAGRLGFLAQIGHDELKIGLEKILKGEFKIQERLMLKCQTSVTNTKLDALNDIVLKGGAVSRTSRLFLSINGNKVCDYLADGLIISTPTGSTAYNLSAHGPIIMPTLKTIAITPICPHSLTVRPLVVSQKEKIEIRTENTVDITYVTADGQENCRLEKDEAVFIEKSDKKAKLVMLTQDKNNFYRVLRQKLYWGL
ncbi:MAG: NAD(+)/NADH kinase [Candidatus Gastranaerophilales bacterium]|nr:NAD(+)/NADH kinase [Candidatus Gastranaerophilales bacterium]